MTKIIIFEDEDKIILPKCGGDVAPISLEVLLLEMLGNVNIGCFQTPGPEIDELVRYVCRTEDNLSLRRLDLFIANNEQGISLTDDENLVIGCRCSLGPCPTTSVEKNMIDASVPNLLPSTRPDQASSRLAHSSLFKTTACFVKTVLPAFQGTGISTLLLAFPDWERKVKF